MTAIPRDRRASGPARRALSGTFALEKASWLLGCFQKKGSCLVGTPFSSFRE